MPLVRPMQIVQSSWSATGHTSLASSIHVGGIQDYQRKRLPERRRQEI
jgi:hypothetical protein